MRFSSFHPSNTGVEGSAPSSVGTIGNAGTPTITASTTVSRDGVVKVYMSGSWAGVADAVSYDVEIDNGTTWVVSSPVASLTGFEMVVNPTSPLTYRIRVKGVNRNGLRSAAWSAYSNSIVATGDVTAPAVPTGVAVTRDGSSAVLTWTNPTDRDLSYVEVRHALSNNVNASTVVGRIAGTTFTHSKLTEGTTNYYWVRGLDNSSNAGDYAAVISVAMPAVFYHTVPANVSGTPSLAYTTAVLLDGTAVSTINGSWTAVADAVSYLVEITNTTTSVSWLVYAPDAFLKNIPVTTGNSYNIKVKALNAVEVGSPAWSTTSATVTAAGDVTAPAVPTGITAVTADFSSVVLSWINPTDRDFSYIEISHSLDNVTFAVVGKISGTTFTHAKRTEGTTNYYRLRALDYSANASSYTTIVSVAMPAVFYDTVPANVSGTPSLFTVSSIALDGTENSTLRGSWTAVSNAKSYDIEIYDVTGNIYWTISSPDAGIKNVPVITGRSYNIKVKAVNSVETRSPAWSTTSATVTAGGDVTAPDQITSLSVTAGTSKFFFSWTDPTAADFSHVKIYGGTSTPTFNSSTLYKKWVAPGGIHTFEHSRGGLDTYFWIATVDYSGNESSPTASGQVIVPLANPGQGGWTSDNDGSGSGLDADLLDGVQGVNYARLDTGNVGNITLNNGADRYISLGSSTNYNYQLITAGDHFQIREASDAAKVRFTITYPNGYVGIGTTGPQSKLQINYSNPATVPAAGAGGHAIAAGAAGYGFATGALTSGDAYIQATRWDGSATNYGLLLQPNGGNVGINTTAPTERLHVNGRIMVTGSGYTINAVGGVLGYYAGALAQTYLQAPVGGEVVIWNAATAQMAVFKADNSVGIGTASPSFVGLGGNSLPILVVNGSVTSGGVSKSDTKLGQSTALFERNGWWGLRAGTDDSFNIDTYNGNNPISPFTVYQNGTIRTAGGMKKYSITTANQGNVNSKYELMRISRDPLNWSANSSYIVTIHNKYFSGGGRTVWHIAYGFDSSGTISCIDARGPAKFKLYFGAEVTINANVAYRPVFIDIVEYRDVSIEVEFNTNVVTSITDEAQVHFTGTITAGSGALYSGDTHLVPDGGRVGIGTLSPSTHLELYSSAAAITLSPSAYAGSYRTVLGTTAGAMGILQFGNNGGNQIRFGHSAAGGAGSIYVNNTVDYTSATDGTLAMHFASNGNVGIGIAAPTHKLQIVGASGSDVIAKVQAGSSNDAAMLSLHGGREWRLKASDSDVDTSKFVIRDESVSADRLVIDYLGLVGIGTSAPMAALDVVGGDNDGLQYRTSTRAVGLGMQSAEAAVYWGSGTRLNFTSGGAIPMTILADGKVGIGTTAPQGKLQILTSGSLGADTDSNNEVIITGPDRYASGSLGNLFIMSNSTPADNAGGSLTLGGIYSGTNVAAFGKIMGVREANSFTGALTFHSRKSDGAMPERMRINRDGNVGIGTTSPSQKLDVAGNAYISARVGIGAAPSTTVPLKIVAPAIGDWTVHVIGSTASSQSYGIIVDAGTTSNDWNFYSRNTSGGFLAGLRGDGNFGIGTSSPAYQLEVGKTTGGIIAISTAGSAGLTASPLLTTLNFLGYLDKVKAAITAEDREGNVLGGWLNFHTMDTGNVSRKRVTIDPNGFFGIGTDTPQYRLDVNKGSAGIHASFGTVMASSGEISGIHFGYAEAGNALYRKSALVFERSDAGIGDARGKIHLLNAIGGSASATLADAKFTIDTAGNIGIGVTSPSQKLHVDGMTQTTALYNTNWNRSQTAYGYIDFGPANEGHGHIYTDRPTFYFNKEIFINGSKVVHAGDFSNSNNLTPVAADTLAKNGISYVSSNISLFGQTDGALYSQAYSSDWQHQIYGDYRTGSMAIRGKNNGTWQSWRTVWDSGNDGAGSGLDADLLDGYNTAIIATASTVAVRDTNGYLQATWYGTSNGMYASNGNGVHFNIGGQNWGATLTGSSTNTRIQLLSNAGADRGSIYVDSSNYMGFLTNTGAWKFQMSPQGSSGTTLTGASTSVNLTLLTSDSVGRGSFYADSSNNVGFLDNTGTWALQLESGSLVTYRSRSSSEAWMRFKTSDDVARAWVGGTSSGSVGMTDGSGNWRLEIPSVNPPVIRVNGTMRGILHSGDNVGFDNTRYGLVGVYDPAHTQAIWAMGSSYKLPAGGASNNYGNHYGLAWSYEPDHGGAGNNPQSKTGLNHQLLIQMAGVTHTAIGTGIWTSGYIDNSSANGGWVMGAKTNTTRLDWDTATFRFLNSSNGWAPVSTGVLAVTGTIAGSSTITAGGAIGSTGGPIYSAAGDGNGFRLWGNDSTYTIFMGTSATYGRIATETTSDYNTYFRMGGGTNRGWNFSSGGTMVAGIDASGTLRTNSFIRAKGSFQDRGNNEGVDRTSRYMLPVGASYTTTSSSVTGAIRIRLPIKGSSAMLKMRVEVFSYSTGTSHTFVISGYPYDAGSGVTSWINCSAEQFSESGTKFSVRFGYDGTYDYVYIGELATVWPYPQVFVTEFVHGYSGYSDAWSANWAVSFVTSFDTITHSRAAGYNWNSANDGAGSGLDADLLDGIQGSQYLRNDVDAQNIGVASLYLNGGRGLSMGYSGGNYGGIGFNITYTGTGGVHIAPSTDTASRLDFNSGGMSLYGNAVGAAGRTVAWTTVLQVPLSGNMLFRGDAVWTAGNDGAGSGLDADLLDGMNATSAYTPSTIMSRDGSGNVAARDITASRGTTGILFLNDAATRYLYYDGTTYSLPSAPLSVGGNITASGTVTGTEFYSGSGNYFRAGGTGGFYCETYNGGWNMTDGTWLRSIADKGIITGGAIQGATVTATSDLRLKTEITPLTNFSEVIDATNVYSFIKDGTRQWGVIAQEVLRTPAALLVHEGGTKFHDGTPILTVDFAGFTYALLAEVKELRKRVALLEAR